MRKNWKGSLPARKFEGKPMQCLSGEKIGRQGQKNTGAFNEEDSKAEPVCTFQAIKFEGRVNPQGPFSR